MKKYFLFPFLLILLCLPALLPLFHSGFFLTDDGNSMVIRFSAFYEVLKSGEFPVRFLTRLNNGFGYPVSNFLYPLFMYLGVPIHVLGASFADTIKILLGVSLLASSIFSFFWLKKFFDNLSSLLGAVFYTLFPYHLYDIYKRGSVGEALALAIVPFILWQIERKSILLTSIGISFLILSHNTLAFLLIPLIFVYALLKSKKLFKFISITVVSGLGLSSFFWIPAAYDLQYTVFKQSKVSNFYNYFIDKLDLNLIGIASLVLLFSLGFLLFLKKETGKNKFVKYFFLASLLIIFLTTSFSKSLWELIPLTNIIQFPFRLISLLIALLSFELSFSISQFEKSKKILVAIIFLILIFISAKPYLVIQSYQYLPDSFYATNMDTTTIKNEYMPKWVKEKNLVFTPEKVKNLTGEEKLNITSISAKELIFNTYLTMDRKIQINLVYFPGWNAYVNGVKKEIDYLDSGLIKLNLEKGENNVRVVFEETTLRFFSDLLSIISVVALLLLSYLLKIKKYKI